MYVYIYVCMDIFLVFWSPTATWSSQIDSIYIIISNLATPSPPAESRRSQKSVLKTNIVASIINPYWSSFRYRFVQKRVSLVFST